MTFGYEKADSKPIFMVAFWNHVSSKHYPGIGHRVPTAPGKPEKITTVFPVLEKYWNFIILLKIVEKWE